MPFRLTRLTFLQLAAAVLFLHPRNISAGVEGPRNAASASGTYWKTPTNVYYSDNQRTNYNNAQQDIMSVASFGFSAVTGTVDGVKVEIEGYGTGANPPTGDEIDVALTKNGSTPAGSWKLAMALPNGIGNEAYIICGGAADLWGTTWVPSEIMASNFGVLIRDADMIACNLYIDHVRVTVYYTISFAGGRRLKLQKILTGD